MSDISFNIDYNKVIAIMMYIINKVGGKIEKYKLMQILFAADKYHLNKYGRPVTGDYYVKKEYGIVPANVENMIDAINSPPDKTRID